VLGILLGASLIVQEHEMRMSDTAGWRVSLHGDVFLQYVHTYRTRGDYQFGSVNRFMLDVGEPLGGGVLQARTTVSAEPLTLTERGAPQLLQVAFIADGETITDHMHPSPWIMELAVAYERPLTPSTALSLYGAAIGGPALGPPVYLHRASAMENPSVPLGHHAQDVTHSSYGVVTLGLGGRVLRVEVSAFNDRQPDEASTVFFYEGARLDSYAGRATIFVGPWSFMPFYGYLPAASGGHTHGAMHRAGFAVLYNLDSSSVTAVYSANDPVGSERRANTVLVEWKTRWHAGQLFYARAEYVQRTDEELSLVGSVGPLLDVEALQAGYARAVTSVAAMPARVGAYVTVSLVPPSLEPFYGGHGLLSIAVYGQLSIGR
jgi:hypothetical protein